MKNRILGLMLAACGVLLMIASVFAEVAWLGLCFGTIIVGFLMLLFVPSMLLLPFTFISSIGVALFIRGLSVFKEQVREEGYGDYEFTVADEARLERKRKLAALTTDCPVALPLKKETPDIKKDANP